MADVIPVFAPGVDQQRLHAQLKRFNIWTCHRGLGKTFLGIHELLRFAAERDAVAPVRLAYITDLRINAKQKAWEPVVEPFLVRVPQVTADRGELALRFPGGSDVLFFGSREDEDRIRGWHGHAVVFDEYALIPPRLWSLVVMPALLRHEGGAIFMGTPKGRNHFYQLYRCKTGKCGHDGHEQPDPEWSCITLRASETSVYSAEQLERMRREQTPEEYAQEYECSWDTPMQGAVYGTEMNAARLTGRVRAFAHDPALTVETWWDLGHTDATAIIFTQTIDREIRIIDYLEDERKDLAFYAQALQSKPYAYERDHLPHDAGAQRLEGGGQSIESQWRKLRSRTIGITVHPRQEVLGGIHLARAVFARCYFATPSSDRLLEALESYHYEWDRKRNIAKPEPDHDWSSHAADAFRLMATHLRKREAHAGQPRYAATKWDRYGGYDKISAQRRAQGSLS